MNVDIRTLTHGAAGYTEALALAEALGQAKYIVRTYAHASEQLLFGAFKSESALGFLLLLLQPIGADERRPPIVHQGRALTEGYVEAFGVASACRRRGIGQALQEHAIAVCRSRHCYQIRSRSPTTSVENYALKLKMGYAIQPSNQNDSYYFIKKI